MKKKLKLTNHYMKLFLQRKSGKKSIKFQYLCGFPVEKFDILLEYLLRYSHAIIYLEFRLNYYQS